jgi:murein L,D-transpeptidase YcbB/YkuD
MRRSAVRVLLFALAIVPFMAGCGRLRGGGDADQEMQQRIHTALDARRPPFVTADAEGRRLWKETRAFYEARHFAPAWIERRVPRPEMDEFIDALEKSAREGIDPDLYGASELKARHAEATRGFLSRKGFDTEEAGRLDVWLTYLYMKFASDLADGISDLARADDAWQIEPEKFDPRAALEKALAEHRIAQSLEALAPTTPQYKALRSALAAYREIAAAGGWPALPSGFRLKPGQRNAGVAQLARRLSASGDYKGTIESKGTAQAYGPELQEAMKRFQRRHGLTEDAVVGPAALAALNLPVTARIRQIELNMERWRWLPRDLGKRYLLVNIPAYRLEVWEDGRVPLSMPVVVGKKDSPTPIFADRMTYIVFSPYWNVPPDIARDETLPSMLKDPDFLARTNMEIVDRSGAVVDASDVDLDDPGAYRFRQRPGGSNALGLVKFMFPNQFNVYLHDTPADSLFELTGRSLSHGCVRVAEPEALAAYVLRDQPEWTAERIEEAMHAEEERTVKLSSPLPVYLGYWTAEASADGLLRFADDVYGVDARQERMMAERVSRMRRSAAAAPAVRPGDLQAARPPAPSDRASGTWKSARRGRLAGTASQ